MANFVNRIISPDDVAWIKDALWRYSETANMAKAFPRVSKLRKGAESICLLEIMDILGLQFQNEAARMNAFSGLLTKTTEECANPTKGSDNE